MANPVRGNAVAPSKPLSSRGTLSAVADTPPAGGSESDDRVVLHALHILESRARTPGPSFTTIDVAATWFHLRLSESPQEVMAVAWLDEGLRLIEFQELFRGTVNCAAVHVREVVKAALACNAVNAIVAHNHPSGDPTPSAADARVTRELRAALALVDVKLVDHVVVAPGAEPVSMAQRGLLELPLARGLPRGRRVKKMAGQG